MKIINFAICGPAALRHIDDSPLSIGNGNAGTGMEFKVITAVILAVQVCWRRRKYIRAFLGSLLMGLISNGLNLLGVDVIGKHLFWRGVIDSCCYRQFL